MAGIAGGDANYGEVQFDDFRVVHNWTPNPRNLLLDFHQTGAYNGDHVPSVIQLPDRGLLVTWESGSNHQSPDLVMKAQYRSPSGRWYPPQVMLAMNVTNGLTNTYVAEPPCIVTNAVWFAYDRSTNAGVGMGEYYRVLTVSNGILSLGAEQNFPFCQTNGANTILFSAGIYQIPSGPYAGRYVFERGVNTGGSSIGGDFIYSPDGANWFSSGNENGFDNVGETSICQEPNGTLVAIQNNGPYLLRSTSADGGATWTTWATNFNLPSVKARPMVHSLPSGLYGVATTQGPNARTNGVIYICDSGSTVISTILFGWYGTNKNTVQYPDFIMDGDSIFTVWSEAPLGGIHASACL